MTTATPRQVAIFVCDWNSDTCVNGETSLKDIKINYGLRSARQETKSHWLPCSTARSTVLSKGELHSTYRAEVKHHATVVLKSNLILQFISAWSR